MEYRILGPLEVTDGGDALDLGSRQQRGLLALLLLHPNRVVSTDRILEELWPDDPTGKERTLWVYISRLRSLLEPDRAHGTSSVLVTRDHGYSLVVDDAALDARRFEQLATDGNRLLRDDPGAAATMLDEALGLWRGDALEDVRYEEFAQADAARLEELRLVALEDRIDAEIRLRRHRTVLGELERLVARHPHRERLVSLQMIALYRAGRQADALRAYERYRHRIGDELGIDPSPELQRIEEQVLLHDPRLGPPPGDDDTDDAASPGQVLVNPFRGLQSFGEADAPLFFGRDRVTTEIVRRIADGGRLVALVGASGSGKSSLLHAGLVPALRKGAVEGSQDWLIVPMVPGSRPFHELEAALLRAAVGGPDSLGELLSDPEDGILRSCLRVLPDGGRVVLVIDQFEELFTLGASPGEVRAFVRNLEVVLDDAHGRIVVAVALRADFYGRPLDFPRFAAALGVGIVNVSPLAPDELEVAAERPAAHAGATLEPALVVQLLADVAGEPGALPLFQYALTELFDRRDGTTMTLRAYEDMGGVAGALARRAEDLLLDLGEDERHAATQLFLRLVTVVDQGAWARRRVAASEIVSIAADVVALQRVMQRFVGHRLLTVDRDLASGSATVEVAHEALLTAWPRLRRWIEDGRKDVITRAHLDTALSEWAASGEKADYLLSGERLADYEAWAQVSTLELTTAEERFLDASILQREERALAEEERQAREVKLGRQARTRLWGLGVGGALVAATVGATLLISADDDPAIALFRGVADDRGETDLLLSGAANAERAHDVVVERKSPLVDPQAELRQLAESGVDLVIVGSRFDLDLDRVAPDYPDVRWVAIDPVAVHTEAPQITEIHFDVLDSAFLAGAAAAMTTRTDQVGFIGAYQSFRSESSRSGFEQGVAAESPDVTVSSAYLGPVASPLTEAERQEDLAYELASSMYDAGVDIIFHDAGAAGLGVVRAAVDRSTGGDRVWTIGSDADEFWTLPEEQRDVVLTSTVKRFDIAVEHAVEAFLAGDLEGGELTLGLADGGVELSRSGNHLDRVDGVLRDLQGDLEFGHRNVVSGVAGGAAWQLDADATLELVLTDDGCSIGGVSGAAELFDEVMLVDRGAVLLVEMVNASGSSGGFALRSAPPDVSLEQLRRESLAGGPAASLETIHNITEVQLGGATNGAVVIGGEPVVPNCIVGDPSSPTRDHIALIVKPRPKATSS